MYNLLNSVLDWGPWRKVYFICHWFSMHYIYLQLISVLYINNKINQNKHSLFQPFTYFVHIYFCIIVFSIKKILRIIHVESACRAAPPKLHNAFVEQTVKEPRSRRAWCSPTVIWWINNLNMCFISVQYKMSIMMSWEEQVKWVSSTVVQWCMRIHIYSFRSETVSRL